MAYVANNAREAGVHALGGLIKTMQMDAVPKRMRGRWNASDTLVAGTYSLGGLLGGLLIHGAGYQAALLAMAAGFVVATAAFLPLAGRR